MNEKFVTGGTGDSEEDNIWEQKLSAAENLSDEDASRAAEAMGKTRRFTDMPDEADDQYFKNYEDATKEEEDEIRAAFPGDYDNEDASSVGEKTA
ncbi:hypothetical protein IKF03_02705 [Candidatus Saccharibacteria bacterium]|nr:hypothetical protein [Candidatus Saccharibacteria bacterium]